MTPSLRAVTVRLSYPMIQARFIYDYLTDTEPLLVAEAESGVIADFTPPVDARFVAVELNPSHQRELLEGEEWLFRRREE